jgi:hypothetical protein
LSASPKAAYFHSIRWSPAAASTPRLGFFALAKRILKHSLINKITFLSAIKKIILSFFANPRPLLKKTAALNFNR